MADLRSWSIPAREPGTGPAPLAILLHGVGANETGMLDLAEALDPRFAKLVLRAPLAFGPGSYGWFHVDFTPAGPVHNAAEAEASRALLADWIPQAARAAGADPGRVFLLGFSQGAILSLSVLLTRPDLVAGVAAWSGRTLPEALRDRHPGPELAAREALVIHGRDDRTLPVQHGRNTREWLEAIPLRRVEYHELAMGHEVTAGSLALTGDWLARAAGFPGTAGAP